MEDSIKKMMSQSNNTILFISLFIMAIMVNFEVLFDNEYRSDIVYGNHLVYRLNLFIEIIVDLCISLVYLFIMISLNIYHHTFDHLFFWEFILTIISFVFDIPIPSLLFHIINHISNNSNKINYYKLICNGDVNSSWHYSEMKIDDKKYFIDDSLLDIKMNDKFEIGIIEKVNNQEIPLLFDIDNKISQGKLEGININDFMNARLELVKKINSQIKLLKEHIDEKEKEIDKKKKIIFENDSNLNEMKKFINEL